jgi:hypothetical protein
MKSPDNLKFQRSELGRHIALFEGSTKFKGRHGEYEPPGMLRPHFSCLCNPYAGTTSTAERQHWWRAFHLGAHSGIREC